MTDEPRTQYDLIIVGSGPGGITAGIYAKRYHIDVSILTKDVGGIAATAHKVCNFPSYEEISGFSLMQKMKGHLDSLEVPLRYEEVKEITKENGTFTLKTLSDKTYKARKVIIAAGTLRQTLSVPGEKEFYGKGVSYCATCDAPFYKGKTVAVVGGSDAALTAALLLAEIADHVYIIYRRDDFYKGEPAWVDLVKKNDKIEPIFNQTVTEITGESFVTGVTLTSGNTLDVGGVFIEVGSKPNLGFLENMKLETNEGYLVVDSRQETSVKGLFAVGDIVESPFKQIVVAASQGAIAAYAAYKELMKGEDD